MNKAEEWAVEQWGGADLGDERRTQRAVLLGTALAANPGGGLPKQTDQWGDLKAAYRLLSNDAVSHEALQKEHRAQVRQLALAQDRVLFIQDTTELDYTKHNAVEGLGPIGDHVGKGLLAHSCLAVTPKGVVLGLAYQQVWARQECAFKPAESRGERARRENKESAVWGKTLTGIGQAAMGAQWVSVGDRGSDIFAYWRQAHESGWHCLLRVFVERRIEPCGPTDHLLAHARQLAPMAQGELTLRARPGQAARVASLQIAWSAIRVRAPRNDPGSAKATALDASVIRVWEQDVGGLEWVLLATWPVHSAQDAWQCVSEYRLRWTIEEYHKCLKTGCRIESAQLKSADGLKALLGFHGVIAAHLLQMSKNADDAPDALAMESFMPEAVEVMAKRTGLPCNEMTVARFRLELAKLGGFIGRKSDGKPGWQTMWRGWQELMLMTIGYMIGKSG